MAEGTVERSDFGVNTEMSLLKTKELVDILGLECDICNEEYEMPDKPPKLLPCHHTICLPCLNGINSHQCPVCRAQHDPFDAKDLPTDFKVVSGLDAIKRASDNFKNVCLKHNCQSLDRFCALCISPVCNDCVKLNHKEEEGHVIMEMEKALEENASRFDDLENKCEEFLNRLEKRQEVTNNVMNNLDINERELKRSVRRKFREYRDLLVDRKASLLEKIQGKIAKRKETLELESESLQQINDEVKGLYDSFKASKESEKLEEMFALQKRFIKDENKLVKDFSNEELCDSYEFKLLNEELLKTSLTILGDLHTKLDVQMILSPPSHDSSDSSDSSSDDDMVRLEERAFGCQVDE